MKPLIALTFDDGPSEHTSRIVDTLSRHGGKASFFVLGNKLEEGKEIVLRTHATGNEIISHSWTHCKEPNLSELSEDEMRKELTDTHEAIRAMVGDSPKMFRPPYGAVTDELKKVAAELDLAIIIWSVDSWDWRDQKPDAIFDKIFSNIHDDGVILCHDTHASTADAMERVIPALCEKYTLVTMTELMQSRGVVPQGKVAFPVYSDDHAIRY